MPAGILHHLIDILDPSEEFSAGDFHDRAHAATRDILSRGKLPILVGGTGFYLRMFIFGKPKGGSPSRTEEQEVMRLIDVSKAARAIREGVPVEQLSDQAAWEAGVQVLFDLGDTQSGERCTSTLLNCV
jgi:tRNA dimethylallyltransferase